MKNILIFSTVLFLILSGCSTQKLYDAAVNYERGGANFSVKTAQTEFGKIVYLENDVSSKSTIVLLHGFGGDKDNWNRFSAKLDSKYHIIAPDISGFGESDAFKNQDYSLSKFSDTLSQFLKSIHVSNLHIVGNSMGGAIAIVYAAEHPSEVTSLTLISPAGIKKVKSDFDNTIMKTGKNPLVDVCTEEAFDKLLSFGMYKRPYIPGLFMDLLVADKCSRSEIEQVIYKGTVQNIDLSQKLPKITVPTLIIWGDKDRILHVDNARFFQEAIKGSQLSIFKDLGHVPLIEDPEKTANRVIKFLSEAE